MNASVIKVAGLSKQYTVGALRQPRITFYDLLTQSLKAPLRHLRSARGENGMAEQFWALHEINFEVQPGEVVGVIGRNGAGKSTLLKILSRITAPSRGRVEVRGRLASLLEVGTGFHPELSGRENIYLNGAILGMSRGEINRKFGDIVAFAEVEQFIDTPVKRYSSGMYVRLAFAVAAHLDSDVLVVDEVLSVGDTVFQDRCLRKMEDVSRGGRTVLFVSHNLGAISRLCSRAILLQGGRIEFDGNTSSGLARYSKLNQNNPGVLTSSAIGTLLGKTALRSITINGSDQLLGSTWKPADEIELGLIGRLLEPLRSFRVTFFVFKEQQLVVSLHDAERPSDMPAGDFESVVRLPCYFLSPGEYSIDIHVYSEATSEWLVARGAVLFSIATEWAVLYEPSDAMGIVNLQLAGTRRAIARTLAATDLAAGKS
jgi:lipopolysaccharide transport system ATP-binding protein